jgi:DNA-binding MarR family transcriptional regulator
MELGRETMDFVKSFEGWVRRASVTTAGESVPRLQLLNELHCNGPQKMADLAESLGVTPRAVTTMVDTLETESLVRRVPHPTDRRITMIEIQPAGTKTVEHGFGAFEAAVEELFGDLSEDDAKAMRRALAALRARIDAPKP